MKRLLLLRHGKSDWGADYGRDHDRPLKGRGVRAARTMGRLLTDTNQQPELIVSSSAVRALSTAELATEAGGWDCEIRVEPGLYGAGTAEILREIQALDNVLDTVMLTGHEPTFSSLAALLIGGGHFRFPTAAVACIAFATDRWEQVDFGRGALHWFAPPKLIQRALGDER